MADSWEMERKTAAIIGELNRDPWFKAVCAKQREEWERQKTQQTKAGTVRQVSIRDSEALNRNLQEIASGRIVVVDPDLTKVGLSSNEILANNQTAMNNNIGRIARGELKVRF